MKAVAVIVMPLLLGQLGNRLHPPLGQTMCTGVVVNLGDLACCDIPGDADYHCKKQDLMTAAEVAAHAQWCAASGGTFYELEDAKGCFEGQGGGASVRQGVDHE